MKKAISMYHRDHPTVKTEEQGATAIGYSYGELNVNDVGEWESKAIVSVPMGRFKIRRTIRYDDSRLSPETYKRMGKPYPKEPIWIKTKVDISLALEDGPPQLFGLTYVMIDCEFGAGRYVIESAESSRHMPKGESKSRSMFDYRLHLVNPLDDQLCTKPWTSPQDFAT